MVGADASSPSALRSERGLLGAILLDARLVERVGEIVKKPDFQRPDHGTIYAAVQELAQHSSSHDIDIQAVADFLDRGNELERIGGVEYLGQLVDDAVAPANAMAFAHNVRDAALRRELLQLSQDMSDIAQNPGQQSAAEILDEIRNRVMRLDEHGIKGPGLRPIQEMLQPLMDEIEAQASGKKIPYIPTGFGDLDRYIMGLREQALLVLAGRPGMGKTALAMSMVANLCKRDPQAVVLVFSMEMAATELMTRLISTLSGVFHSKLTSTEGLTRTDWKRIGDAEQQLRDSGLHIDDTAGLTPDDLRSRVFRLNAEMGAQGKNIALIVVDYIQLMRAPGYKDNRVAEVSDISRSLKELAKNFNVPVLALSQLNRQVESRKPPEPNLSDLRESGSIEQDADLVMLIYDPSAYDKEKAKDEGTEGVVDIKIAKQRSGVTGTVKLYFDKRIVAYKNYLVPQHSDNDDIGQ